MALAVRLGYDYQCMVGHVMAVRDFSVSVT